MKLSRRQLAKVMLDYIRGAKNQQLAASKIAAYLIENKRTGELGGLMREVYALNTAQTGQVEINATSAFPLKPDLKQQVAKLFEARHASFNETIDDTVLGGGRFESQDKRLDLTLSAKLNQLKTSMKENA